MKTVSEHFATWLELASAGQFDGQGDHHTPPACVETTSHKYLECGISAHGFARVRCDDCGDDFLVAVSCKGRSVFPRLPVRQWVLSVPKCLRYYLQRGKGALNAALRIFLRVVFPLIYLMCGGQMCITGSHRSRDASPDDQRTTW